MVLDPRLRGRDHVDDLGHEPHEHRQPNRRRDHGADAEVPARPVTGEEEEQHGHDGRDARVADLSAGVEAGRLGLGGTSLEQIDLLTQTVVVGGEVELPADGALRILGESPGVLTVTH